jgi:dTDP-4-amino-4,6-dideoxygalactose transaminase
VTRPVEFFRHCLGQAEIESVTEALGSVFITLGPRVGELEKRLAEFLGVEEVVGLSSCSMALVLGLRVLGVGPGDEVITTPMTFVATPNAALQVGARPVFVDIDPATGLIDPDRVEAAITPRTKAILAVGLYGQMADLRRLRGIADRHGLSLVDDAAHSLEAESEGDRTGAVADLTALSFYATKNLTCGDGGALCARDRRLAAELRRLRNHGITKDAATRYGQRYTHWDMLDLGYKSPLTDIQAALLLPQISRIEERRALRQALVERYERELRADGRVHIVERTGKSAHHLFAALVPEGARDRVLEGLGARRIGCAVNYRSIHTLTYYRQTFGYAPDDFPHARKFGERTVSLPLWPNLPPDDVTVVVDAVRAILDEAEAG